MQTPNDLPFRIAYEIAQEHKDSLHWQKPRRHELLVFSAAVLGCGGMLLALMVLVVRLLRD